MSLAGSPSPSSLPESAAQNERWIVLAALALVAALSLYLTLTAGDYLMMAAPTPGTIAHAVVLFIMWWSMMLAMMLPSAAPAILIYGGIRRNFAAKGERQPPLFVFVSGYAVIWTLFSAAAVSLQLLVRDVFPLTGMMAVTSAKLGGVLLLAAGIYQLTPLKEACLRRCQSPLLYFARHWRKGAAGTLRMGLAHGIHCLGCCWVLMGLLFYGGVMELAWIAGLAVYVAAEKSIPATWRVSRFTGVALAAWGLWVLASSIY
ncbi:MAG: DUF2182 domain-containing protein [Rhizobiales bacterium]|nr:DUF2182 domain-containing protein [Hyphomicrobiales bacterium]MBI3673667.1 DUF2182 domain-containing protein [Hyphomicrobiales bacterium]